MLRLFSVFIIVLVFSIAMIPYSHANHDDMPSYIQNNTGWDREIFHEYELFVVTDKFGKFVLPYQFELDDYVPVLSEVKIKDVVINEYIGQVPSFVTINLKNPQMGFYDIAIPLFDTKQPTFTYELIFVDGREINRDLHSMYTHTKYSIMPDFIPHEIEFAMATSDYDFERISAIKITYDHTFPPLKQTQNGVEPPNILCKQNLELISSPSGSPACVKPESMPKLVERGWTT